MVTRLRDVKKKKQHRKGQAASHTQGGSDKITCSNYCWRCIHFTMAFCIEKRNTWSQQTVVYFDLFRSCLQSTSYILVETVLRPAAPRRFHGYWDWRRGRDCGDQQPALSSCSKRFSGGSNVETTDWILSTTCLEYWLILTTCLQL